MPPASDLTLRVSRLAHDAGRDVGAIPAAALQHQFFVLFSGGNCSARISDKGKCSAHLMRLASHSAGVRTSMMRMPLFSRRFQLLGRGLLQLFHRPSAHQPGHDAPGEVAEDQIVADAVQFGDHAVIVLAVIHHQNDFRLGIHHHATQLASCFSNPMLMLPGI
jgi:hypothetical protein